MRGQERDGMNLRYTIYARQIMTIFFEGVETRSSLRDFSIFNALPAVETAGYYRVFLWNKDCGRVA